MTTPLAGQLHPDVRGPERPVMLVTLEVPFAPEATTVAVDSAVESGRRLLVVNVVEILLSHYTMIGYSYAGSDELESALSQAAALAGSLGVAVERLRVASPHPIDALLELVREREPALLVLGPDTQSVRRRLYRKAATRVREQAPCLLWVA